MRVPVALALILFSAPPAMAQTDPAQAWTAQRQDYGGQNARTFDALQIRGRQYLSQTGGYPQGWWADWANDQPYDKNVSGYTPAPGTMDIPVEPDAASDSPYGKNVAALTYGGTTPAAPPGNATANAAADMSDLAGH